MRITTFEGLSSFGASDAGAPAMSTEAKGLWNALMDQGFNWNVVGSTVVWAPGLPLAIRSDLRAEIERAILGGWGLFDQDLMQTSALKKLKTGAGATTKAAPLDVSGRGGKPFPWSLWVGVGLFAGLVLYPWKKKKAPSPA